MNYIGLLTKEEKSTLCEIITGKERNSLRETNRNLQKFKKASELNR